MEISNQTSQTQQPPNQTPIPANNSSNSKLIPIILGIAAAIVIAIGAFVLGSKQSQPVVQSSIQTTPSPSKASATEGDPTANWKTYRNERFSFLYPKELVIQSEKSNEAIWQLEYNGKKLLYQMWLKWQSKPFDEPKVGMTVTIASQSSTISQVDANKTIGLNGKPAKSFYYGCGGDCYHHSIRFNVDNIYYELTGNTPGAGTDENFVQILSTFKFTDQQIDWTKYSNPSSWVYFNPNFDVVPERNFRFKYPTVFSIDNVDSGAVSLKIGSVIYIKLDVFSSSVIKDTAGTAEQKISAYFKYSNPSISFPSEIQKVNVKNSENIILKIPMHNEGACGLNGADLPQWNCYLGIIGEKSLMLLEIKPIPESILTSLLNTIE